MWSQRKCGDSQGPVSCLLFLVSVEWSALPSRLVHERACALPVHVPVLKVELLFFLLPSLKAPGIIPDSPFSLPLPTNLVNLRLLSSDKPFFPFLLPLPFLPIS